jgi:hypothetical protein
MDLAEKENIPNWSLSRDHFGRDKYRKIRYISIFLACKALIPVRDPFADQTEKPLARVAFFFLDCRPARRSRAAGYWTVVHADPSDMAT